jgi:hypothetical protein
MWFAKNLFNLQVKKVLKSATGLPVGGVSTALESNALGQE